MGRPVPYEQIPSGWYVVGSSTDLRAGEVRSVRYFGRDLVLYRTANGDARLVDAYCPHLGAHLGGGCVKADRLVCPFHAFEFDTDGRCVATPYESKRPPLRANLQALPLRDQNGLLLTWFHPRGDEPTWEVPALDMQGWLPFRFHDWTFHGHPQETSENSVDLGHFGVVHNYASAIMTEPLFVDGPTLKSRYAVQRKLDWIGIPRLRAELKFEADVHGLGYSLVRAGVDAVGVHVRLLVLATPIEADHVHLRIAIATRDLKVPGLTALVNAIALRGYVHDVSQDVVVWKTKRFVDRPALAEGDGPIAVYRKWALQFYDESRVSLTVVGGRGESDAAE